MSTLLFASRLVLTAVFAVAGVAKLADRDASAKDLRTFGLPQAVARHAVAPLAAVEIGLAAAMQVDSAAGVAALGAAAVLLAGVARMAWVLAHRRDEDCGCFGSLRRTRIGLRTLARDVLLAAAAIAVVLRASDPGQSPAGWVAALSAIALLAGLLMLCALVALARLLALRRRSVALRMAQRLSAEIGAPSESAPAAGTPPARRERGGK